LSPLTGSEFVEAAPLAVCAKLVIDSKRERREKEAAETAAREEEEERERDEERRRGKKGAKMAATDQAESEAEGVTGETTERESSPS
jgi:hypothetical protein